MSGHELIAHVTFDGVESPYPFALMLPQSETERLLETQLGSFGVTVERNVELTEFVEEGDKVSCAVRHATGHTEAIEAAWLIGCDGAHSIVRHRLGLQFKGDTIATDFVLADLHISGLTTPSDELAIFWHQDGMIIFFPISPGRFRIIADLGPSGMGPRPEPTLPEVEALVDRRGPDELTLSDPIWMAAFGINERKVANYRSGRIFLAGDAAHVHSPAGGQGMNTGMQDAFNLAWKLALIVREIAASDALLDSYSAEKPNRDAGSRKFRPADRHRHDQEPSCAAGAEFPRPPRSSALRRSKPWLTGSRRLPSPTRTALSASDRPEV